MTPLYAGGDWSGKPDKRDEALIFCVVALSDKEAWTDSCRQLRHNLRMAQNAEFHGHEMKDDAHRLQLLQAGREAGMKIGALVLSKGARAEGNETPSYESAALELLNPFFARYALRDLWCDNEIQGKAAQKAFETELQRCHRAIHPNARFKARLRPSHTSDLIQLADVMAYALRTQSHGTLKDAPLERFL